MDSVCHETVGLGFEVMESGTFRIYMATREGRLVLGEVVEDTIKIGEDIEVCLLIFIVINHVFVILGF